MKYKCLTSRKPRYRRRGNSPSAGQKRGKLLDKETRGEILLALHEWFRERNVPPPFETNLRWPGAFARSRSRALLPVKVYVSCVDVFEGTPRGLLLSVSATGGQQFFNASFNLDSGEVCRANWREGSETLRLDCNSPAHAGGNDKKLDRLALQRLDEFLVNLFGAMEIPLRFNSSSRGRSPEK